MAIMVSEYYFYLTAFMEDVDRSQFHVENDPFPTIYRIDRIELLEVTKSILRFHIRIDLKKVSFGSGSIHVRGKLQKTVFWYKGDAVEAGTGPAAYGTDPERRRWRYLISAETFGSGIEMWLRSQGDVVEVVSEEGGR